MNDERIRHDMAEYRDESTFPPLTDKPDIEMYEVPGSVLRQMSQDIVRLRQQVRKAFSAGYDLSTWDFHGCNKMTCPGYTDFDEWWKTQQHD